MTTHLEMCDIRYQGARRIYDFYTRGDTEAARLCRWLSENWTRRYDIFVDIEPCGWMVTLEHTVMLYGMISRSYLRQGSITFIETKGAGPRLFLGNIDSDGGVQMFASQASRRGSRSKPDGDFDITGRIHSTDAFIEASGAYLCANPLILRA